MPWRINLSSRASQLRGGDAIVISIPNSGRTWIRTFLAAYYCARFNHPFSLYPEEYADTQIPRVIYTHDRYEHHTKTRAYERLRSKFLVPGSELKRKPILFLARDPRDTFVSHYLEMTRRTQETADELKRKSASEMIRDPLHGIGLMIQTMNDWMKEFAYHPRCTVVRYEDLQTSPSDHFRRVLNALGESPIAENHFQAALDFSQFGKMKKMEASRTYDPKLLQPGDVSDPDSYKVRRGKVGGYRDYLDASDIAYANSAMARLNPDFGYRT